ncbi:fasciclin domain-containing protein [Saccharicrinis sp. FJH62]|uniref:fasciclin domain-containing protein n=1 Tax=Saccharicrinis sp. FJH62 TaxID=3344657 RepID=UPI0035D46B81
MKTKNWFSIGVLLVALAAGAIFNSCGLPEYNTRTNYQILIGEYLEQNPGEFSTFYDLLEKSNTIAFLKAYGTYTCFAPTNAAFEKYFQEKGVSSIDDFTAQEMRDLVRYHIIIDTIPTTDFVDGRLQTANMYGQYLTTKTYLEGGSSVYKVNKYATIKSADNRMLNGIVHSVESVLDPITPTIAEQLDANPDFSIFTEALKATNWFDTLNLRLTEDDFNFNYEQGDEIKVTRWFTVMAVSNNAFAASGINSYDDLKAKYSDTGDPTNPKDSLYLHMAYHILDSTLMYVSDFASINSTAGYFTKAPLEVITIKVDGSEVLVNEDEFRGVVEKGFAIDRDASDNTANNGVFHSMTADFFIKVRFPSRIHWEVTDQFEIKKIPGVYRKQGVNLEMGQLADIQWYPENYTIYYNAPAGDYYGNVLNDRLQAYIRPEVIKWIQFRTPIVVKGTYKVWICTRNVYPASGRRKPIFFVYVDDEKLPIIIDNSETLNENESDGELELRGFKRYPYNPADSLEQNYTRHTIAQRYTGQLAGTIDFRTTGRHWIKFVAISAYAGNELWLDQIHIIPVEEDQVWPKPNTDDNSMVYKEDLPPQGTFE